MENKGDRQVRKDPYLAPVSEAWREKIEEEVLQTECEASMADERDVLDEMKQLDQDRQNLLVGMRERIERIKQEGAGEG